MIYLPGAFKKKERKKKEMSLNFSNRCRKQTVAPHWCCVCRGGVSVSRTALVSAGYRICWFFGLQLLQVDDGHFWLYSVLVSTLGTLKLCPGCTGDNVIVKIKVKRSLLLHDVVFFRVKDKYKLQHTFMVNPVYLRHENSQTATDFMVLGVTFN